MPLEVTRGRELMREVCSPRSLAARPGSTRGCETFRSFCIGTSLAAGRDLFDYAVSCHSPPRCARRQSEANPRAIQSSVTHGRARYAAGSHPGLVMRSLRTTKLRRPRVDALTMQCQVSSGR